MITAKCDFCGVIANMSPNYCGRGGTAVREYVCHVCYKINTDPTPIVVSVALSNGGKG